ncbi:mitotic spindle assembly checkpoint protein MAD2B [Cloeon dipterum]
MFQNNKTSTSDPCTGRLLEFFEICINQLLYLNKIYPNGVFTKKQKYGVPINSCDHPLLRDYVKKCLLTAQDLLKNGELSKLVVVFISQDGKPLRRICFDLERVQLQAAMCKDNLTRLELQLRDALLRLSVCDRQLPPIPEGCTFKILLETSEDSYLKMCQSCSTKAQYEFLWVQSKERSHENYLVPISSVECANCDFQIFAQEEKKDSDMLSTSDFPNIEAGGSTVLSDVSEEY